MNTVGSFSYNSHDLLGHGGFGMVFKGVFTKNPAIKVAIKRIPRNTMDHNSVNITNEVTILKSLRHKHIVSFYEYIPTANFLYVVMEFCNGGDLSDFLKQHGRLRLDMIRAIFRQLASAMKMLYSKQIIHRDLKPQNILMVKIPKRSNPQQQTGFFKIADFGLARLLPEGLQATTLCGTVVYMAPEVLMSQPYDGRADLYSLGLIAYECLTGSMPIRGNILTLSRLFARRANSTPFNIPIGIRSDFRSFLIGLLQCNPSIRMDYNTFFQHRFLQ